MAWKKDEQTEETEEPKKATQQVNLAGEPTDLLEETEEKESKIYSTKNYVFKASVEALGKIRDMKKAPSEFVYKIKMKKGVIPSGAEWEKEKEILVQKILYG